MGDEYFYCMAESHTVAEAFEKARDAAFWEYGHAGYTGSIAEKDQFEVIQSTPVSETNAEWLAESLIDDPRVADKWGPAGAIPFVFDTREIEVPLPPKQIIGATDDDLKAAIDETLRATGSMREGEFVQSATLSRTPGAVHAIICCGTGSLPPESLADREPQGWLFFGRAST